MTLKKIASFEEFLADSFQDGVYYRELRLSKQEIEYVKGKYPNAIIKKCEVPACSDGRSWWVIDIKPEYK